MAIKYESAFGDRPSQAGVRAGVYELPKAGTTIQYRTRSAPNPKPVALMEYPVCDRLMIRRVISNLLSNAIRYSPPNAPVRVLFQGDGQIQLACTNAGPAIPAADLPRLFDRFYRASRSNPRLRRHGSGPVHYQSHHASPRRVGIGGVHRTDDHLLPELSHAGRIVLESAHAPVPGSPVALGPASQGWVVCARSRHAQWKQP